MLSRVDIKLKSDSGDISVMMSSCFHGALMKMLETSYVEQLHTSYLHPYTQYLKKEGDQWHWIINALDRDASDRLIHTVMKEDEISIHKHDMTVALVSKEYTQVQDSELDTMYNMKGASRNLTIRFVTPTSFKRNGKYVHYPDIRSIYSSLIKKYSVAHDESLPDIGILDELVDSTSIVRYNLHSTAFRLEGVRIPSFVGYISICIDARDVIINVAHMLARFGTYSGVGIKTSIGMGAIEIE